MTIDRQLQVNNLDKAIREVYGEDYSVRLFDGMFHVTHNGDSLSWVKPADVQLDNFCNVQDVIVAHC
jgi:hypothetical protein